MQSQCVQLFGDSGSCILSSAKHDLSGVPHGSILGPRLFNIFINGTPSTISSKLMLYADNLKLIGQALSCEDHTLLQNNIGLLDQWAETWLLKFNVANSCTMSFTLVKSATINVIVSQVTHFTLNPHNLVNRA
ncbi:hypothetical protein QYM36_001472, partial [Artemia franciscana]